MPVHLRPSAPIAPDALLPGDPGRALMLAQELLEKPRMSNHARGLWGYYGETARGDPLTIQATGMGGPSAAIVIQELHELGVRRAIRVGTCGALYDTLSLGDLIVATSAFPDDGTSRRLGADGPVEANAELAVRLGEHLDCVRGMVVTTDLFYEPDAGTRQSWVEAGCIAVEMEAAALFAMGHRLGIQIACALIVSDVGQSEEHRRIEDEPLESAAKAMGKGAAAALA